MKAPDSIKAHPFLRDWIDLSQQGLVVIRSGKAEIGQGIHFALSSIVGNILGIPLDQINVRGPDTDQGPDEGLTAGSLSVQQGGTALAYVAVNLKSCLFDAASHRLAVPVAKLSSRNGVIKSSDGQEISYWELADEVSEAKVGEWLPSWADLETGDYRPERRSEIDAIVRGDTHFLHDLVWPDMLHARVVRPRNILSHLVKLDVDAITVLPGVIHVEVNGDFIGVIAEQEDQAVNAALEIQKVAIWEAFQQTDDAGVDPQDYIGAPAESEWVTAEPNGELLEQSWTRSALYSRPFIAHASIGPSCAVAIYDERLTVWSHSQGVYLLRKEIARVLEMSESNVRVIHSPGAGAYGHNGADDCAMDAAVLARAYPKKPIRVQWTREDEFLHEPYGSAMQVRVKAMLGGNGQIIHWLHDVWSHRHTQRPGHVSGVSLLAARQIDPSLPAAKPPDVPMPNGGIARNAIPIYNIEDVRVRKHLLATAPVRTSSLRSLGAYGNIFAIESFMDELAEDAGIDSIEFRLRHLGDARARMVLEDVMKISSWESCQSDRSDIEGEIARGTGVALARYKGSGCYVAVVCEVEASQTIKLRHVWASVDVGRVISPDGVRAQIEGGIIQSASWTLKEQALVEGDGSKVFGWEDYPTLPFSETPQIDVSILERNDLPPVGAGEGAQGPTSAAIANAVHNALGVRVRNLPLTSDEVTRAMQ